MPKESQSAGCTELAGCGCRSPPCRSSPSRADHRELRVAAGPELRAARDVQDAG